MAEQTIDEKIKELKKLKGLQKQAFLVKEERSEKIHPFAENEALPERLKDYDPVESGGWLRRKINRRRWKKAARSIIVNLELINGNHTSFVVLEKNGGFKFKGKLYLFDNESKYYHVTGRSYCYDYHENICLPLKRKIPAEMITSFLEDKYPDIQYAINPQLLEAFETSNIIEGILKGASLEKWMRMIFIILIIILVLVVIFMIMFMFKTGMFNAVKNFAGSATGMTATTLAGGFQ